MFFCGVFLLDEAEAVDDFVQVEVGVLPGLHDSLFSLKSKGDTVNNTQYLIIFLQLVASHLCVSVYKTKLISHLISLVLILHVNYFIAILVIN